MKIALTTFRSCFELVKEISYLTLRGVQLSGWIFFQIFTADTPYLTCEGWYEVFVVSLITDLCPVSVAYFHLRQSNEPQ